MSESSRHVEVLKRLRQREREQWAKIAHLCEPDDTKGADVDAALDSAVRALEARALAESGDVNLAEIGYAIESPHSVEPSDAERAAFVADWHEKVVEVATLRAELERRDAEWMAHVTDPACAYGCPSPSHMELAVANGWAGGMPNGEAERTGFKVAHHWGWLEHVKTCPNHPQRKAEAEVATLKARMAELEACLACPDNAEGHRCATCDREVRP